MIEQFLERFPYWPQGLAESFGDIIGLLLPESQFYAAAEKFYVENLPQEVVTRYLTTSQPAWHQNYESNFLNPKNQQYRKVYSRENEYIELPVGLAAFNDIAPETIAYFRSQGFYTNQYTATANASWVARMRPYITVAYDSRLVSGVSGRIDYTFEPEGQPFDYSFLSFMSYSSQRVYPGKTYILAIATGQRVKFSGAKSLIALHENGKTLPGIDTAKLYEFATYSDAYEKNAPQISVVVDNAQATARDKLTDYARQLQAQIDDEKRSLENLAITLSNQSQAEAFEVSRDISNLILTAQGVALQISQGLR